MYIALLLMLAGVITGRVLRSLIPRKFVGRLIFLAILFLLFLLGAQIGANELLIANLPVLGGQALLLTLSCIAFSVLAVRLLFSLFSKRDNER